MPVRKPQCLWGWMMMSTRMSNQKIIFIMHIWLDWKEKIKQLLASITHSCWRINLNLESLVLQSLHCKKHCYLQVSPVTFQYFEESDIKKKNLKVIFTLWCEIKVKIVLTSRKWHISLVFSKILELCPQNSYQKSTTTGRIFSATLHISFLWNIMRG